jgi:hypothetical protein
MSADKKNAELDGKVHKKILVLSAFIRRNPQFNAFLL